MQGNCLVQMTPGVWRTSRRKLDLTSTISFHRSRNLGHVVLTKLLREHQGWNGSLDLRHPDIRWFIVLLGFLASYQLYGKFRSWKQAEKGKTRQKSGLKVVKKIDKCCKNLWSKMLFKRPYAIVSVYQCWSKVDVNWKPDDYWSNETRYNRHSLPQNKSTRKMNWPWKKYFLKKIEAKHTKHRFKFLFVCLCFVVLFCFCFCLFVFCCCCCCSCWP